MTTSDQNPPARFVEVPEPYIYHRSDEYKRDRMLELEKKLKDGQIPEDQKVNVQAAIELYRTKNMPRGLVWLQEGRLIKRRDRNTKLPLWGEGFAQQLGRSMKVEDAEGTGFHYTDMGVLHQYQTPYEGLGPLVQVDTANGVFQAQIIDMEVMVLNQDGEQVSGWIEEEGLIMPPANLRLSGLGIRQGLYFATAPGNDFLYVSETKNGLVQQLPTH
ncbi:MAG: hypothetical protein M1817_003916 [Caeruleum heppii]|nr:MAG: hypothetical protein M1817_003916 [Caeruleum heppii]